MISGYWSSDADYLYDAAGDMMTVSNDSMPNYFLDYPMDLILLN